MKLIRNHLAGAFALCLIASWSLVAHADIIPDTGQTRDYNQDLFGQDSRYTINAPSYTKLDLQGKELPLDTAKWSMVRDNLTGLIWELKSHDEGIHQWRGAYTFEEAQTVFIRKLNETHFGGAADWRIPTVKELSRITHKDNVMPAIDKAFFPFTYALDYWTSTPYAKDPAKAWRVHFCRGFAMEQPKTKKFFVRAVRGPLPIARSLVVNGDGTVTDPNSGLMWQQAYHGGVTWQEALAACENSALGGFTDWRLPNAHVLQSIVDFDRSWPAADRAIWHLPEPEDMAPPIPEDASEFEKLHAFDGRFCFWSSSEYASNPERAWNVEFKDGRFISRRKNEPFLYRAVRGGQIHREKALFINAPQQGSWWPVGQNMIILWDARGMAGDVSITLSTEGGKPDTFTCVISRRTVNNGRFEWTVSGKPSVNCVLRIQPLNATDMGTTQGLFTIAPPSEH